MKTKELLEIVSSFTEEHFFTFRVSLNERTYQPSEVVDCYVYEITDVNGNIFVTLKRASNDEYITKDVINSYFADIKDNNLIFEFEIERFKTRKVHYWNYEVTNQNEVILYFNE